jgi:hypothetical protein
MIGLDLGDVALVLLFWIVAPLAWLGITVTCIFRRRRRDALIATLVFVLGYAAVFVALHTDRYSFQIDLRDSGGRPLSGITVDYFTFGGSDRFGRFAPKPRGHVITDAGGSVSITTGHAQSIVATLNGDDRHLGRVEFRAAGRRYPHQLFPSENLQFIDPPEPPPSSGPTKGSWLVPVQPRIKLVVATKPK